MTSLRLRNAMFFDSVEAAFKIKNAAFVAAREVYNKRDLSWSPGEDLWEVMDASRFFWEEIDAARTVLDISVADAYAAAMEVTP